MRADFFPRAPCPTCGAAKLCVGPSGSCGTWASAAEDRLPRPWCVAGETLSWLWFPQEVPQTLQAPLRASGWGCRLETDCTAVCKQSLLGDP